MLENINIKSHSGTYEVSFRSDFSFIPSLLKNEKFFFVMDKKVHELYQKEFEDLNLDRTLLIEADENNKDLTKIPDYVTTLTDKGLKRNHTLLAIGGGITQDITCFISSIVFRGIDWEFIPTTLLAQSDSCIGSKSSINCSGVKNLVGNFLPPRNIYLCLNFLKTLSKDDVLSGIGEIIKVHMVKNLNQMKAISESYDQLSDDDVLIKFLYNGLLFKKELIEIDEYDKGPRNIMNYGHTFGHAIEKATDHNIPHGIAVAMGMDMANLYSLKFGMTKGEEYQVSHEALSKLYSAHTNVALDTDTFFSAIRKDKKNIGNNITLIIPKGDESKLSKVPVPFDENFKAFCSSFFNDMAGI